MRRIDSKFSTNQDGEIVKDSNGEILPHDEPLFLIRARDYLAVKLLQLYRELSVKDGCNDWHMAKLNSAIAEFEKFKLEHPKRMKQPSVTRGA